MVISIIILVNEHKGIYNGIRYLSKNGHYYTENYGSSYPVIKTEYRFLTSKVFGK